MFCCAMSAAHPGQHSPDCEKRVPGCANHRVKAHDQTGLERWCDFCGRDEAGNQIVKAAGGWGTP